MKINIIEQDFAINDEKGKFFSYIKINFNTEIGPTYNILTNYIKYKSYGKQIYSQSLINGETGQQIKFLINQFNVY